MLVERATTILPASPAAIEQAALVLRQGGLVAFPTETVYGLGADAENAEAMRTLFAAKGRPPDHPLIVHVASSQLIEPLAARVTPEAWQLAESFWPGPMTLVLRRSSRVSDLVTGGLDTVGVRVPGHPVALGLLREFGRPVAAPSANRFGRVSATRAAHVLEELGGRIDLILDGGECQVGIESTIIDLSGDGVAVLRPGAVTVEQIAALLGRKVMMPTASAPRVPGALPSHYAPRARIEIVTPAEITDRARQLVARGQRVGILGDPPPIETEDVVFLILPRTQVELAQQLYVLLRRADELRLDVALVSLPQEQGLGAAVADRLRRAAGPRAK